MGGGGNFIKTVTIKWQLDIWTTHNRSDHLKQTNKQKYRLLFVFQNTHLSVHTEEVWRNFAIAPIKLWSVWTAPDVSDTMILFIFPPNFAHLLPHFLRTAHLDNFELNATQSILKSDLQAPRSFFLTLATRISQIFGSLPLLSLVLVESTMRNGDFMMYHEQKQRIMDIFTW